MAVRVVVCLLAAMVMLTVLQQDHTSLAFTIPVRYDGFVFHPQGRNPVVLEKFIDPLCPDCKQSWPVIQAVIQHYGSALEFIGHPFPNPFHYNAYFAGRLLHVAQAINSSLVYPLLGLIYENQDSFSNANTAEETSASVTERFVALAGKLGASTDQFRAGFQNAATDQAARISFKYGCSRVVTSTPTFLVNGVLVEGADQTWTLEDWVNVLDPLIYGSAKARANWL